MRGKLIIFSGLPGSGKSTLAAKLAPIINATYLRIDTIEQGLRDVCDIEQIDGKGYRMAYRIAQENLVVGNTVIADSVNPWKLTRDEWNQVARDVEARFINIEIVCSDEREHRKRVEGRSSPVPGLKMPTWEDVIKRDYFAWTESRLVVDTSGKSIDESLNQLLDLIRSEEIQ